MFHICFSNPPVPGLFFLAVPDFILSVRPLSGNRSAAYSQWSGLSRLSTKLACNQGAVIRDFPVVVVITVHNQSRCQFHAHGAFIQEVTQTHPDHRPWSCSLHPEFRHIPPIRSSAFLPAALAALTMPTAIWSLQAIWLYVRFCRMLVVSRLSLDHSAPVPQPP